MPATTYLRRGEFAAPTGHALLDQLVSSTRALTGEDWRADRRAVYERVTWAEVPLLRPWRWAEYLRCVDPLTARRRAPHYVFSLYVCVDPQGLEFQIINFARDSSGTSINHLVGAELCVAYLYGQLAGVQQERWRVKQQGVKV